jgi:hypothetical protein
MRCFTWITPLPIGVFHVKQIRNYCQNLLAEARLQNSAPDAQADRRLYALGT